MPSRPQTGIDADSLQADVMRFMAIIAFCLIAILALVRNIDAPPVAQPPVTPSMPEPIAKTTPAPVPVLAPEPQPEPEPVKQIEPVAKQPVQKATPKPPTLERLPQPSVPPEVVIALEKLLPPEPTLLEPIAPAPPPEPIATIKAEPTTPLPTHAAKEPIPAPLQSDDPPIEDIAATQPSEEPEGLSLRFVSDRDFLRLLSKRDIQVYLFNEQAAYQLSPAYEFVDAEPPNKLYEVLPMTIPGAISAAAGRALGDHSDYRWGLHIPGAIERQITDHLAAVESGELVIDRFGRVHHVPAS
ncbi:MAG: hypothetical protein ACR2PZ_09095 [Pseudomonadales bacterium]